MTYQQSLHFLRIVFVLALATLVAFAWTLLAGILEGLASPEDATSFYCWTDQGCDPSNPALWSMEAIPQSVSPAGYDWPAVVEITVSGGRAKFTPACPEAFFNGYRVSWEDTRPDYLDLLAMPEKAQIYMVAGSEPLTRLSLFWSDDLEYQHCDIPASTGTILIDPPPMATRTLYFLPLITR